MKTSILSVMVLLFLLVAPGISQEKSKKELKQERKLELQKQIETLINSKVFVFVGKTALPTGMRTVNLTTNPNFVKFHPDLIESEMPYFGKAYSGAGYGGDTGLKFKGKPESFNVVKNNKNYKIDAVVSSSNDNFRLSLTVGLEGNGTLTIISNNRSSISYQGDISTIK